MNSGPPVQNPQSPWPSAPDVQTLILTPVDQAAVPSRLATFNDDRCALGRRRTAEHAAQPHRIAGTRSSPARKLDVRRVARLHLQGSGRSRQPRGLSPPGQGDAFFRPLGFCCLFGFQRWVGVGQGTFDRRWGLRRRVATLPDMLRVYGLP